MLDTPWCTEESKANVSHCDCGEKKTEKIWHLAGSLGECLKNTTAQQYLSSNRTSQNVLGGYQTDETAFNFL